MPVAPDRRLANLAQAQYGLFNRSQAHAAQISDRMLQSRTRSGTIERVSREVFRVAGVPESWHQHLLVAAWSGGPECCVSHRAAAALHEYDGFRERLVEVLHHQHRDCRVAPGAIVHVTSVLDPCDRTMWGPIPVTTPVRTLIDLGAVVSIERLEEALDSAERDGKIDRDELVARHAELRQRGRNGVGPLATLLEGRHAAAATPRSVLERRMLRLLLAAGLPEPQCQVRVRRDDGRVAFLDLAYPHVRLGIELDGHAWHSTARQRQRDHERQNQVVIGDWAILRFTYEDVHQRPEHVAALVSRALVTATHRRAIPA